MTLREQLTHIINHAWNTLWGVQVKKNTWRYREPPEDTEKHLTRDERIIRYVERAILQEEMTGRARPHKYSLLLHGKEYKDHMRSGRLPQCTHEEQMGQMCQFGCQYTSCRAYCR